MIHASAACIHASSLRHCTFGAALHRCDGQYQLTICNHKKLSPAGRWAGEPKGERVRYGFISAHDLNGDTVAYAEQSSEGKLSIRSKGISIQANIVKTRRQECIDLWISTADAEKLPGFDEYEFEVPSVDVIFELKWSYFHRLHKALSLLTEETIERLVPSSIPDRDESREIIKKCYIDPEFKERLFLDIPQMNALYTIANAQPGVPVIVVGSFGTGKTRLLARAAYQILKCDSQARVLVCAHHQPSADSFLINYFGPLVYSGWEVQNIARMIIRESDRHDDNPETYPEFCFTAHEIIDYNNLQLVITTFGNVLHLQGKVYPGYFTHILIDEGAQTREPEIIIPLWLCGPNTVVAIAGDHKQVWNRVAK